jgi:hypothetical protein
MSVNKQEPITFHTALERIEGSYKGRRDIFEDVLSEAFIDAVKRVLSTGKQGKLTVKLSFSRIDEERLEIKGDLSTSLPEPASDGRTFYHDSRGNLFLEDPRQAKLPNMTPLKRVKKEGEAA